MKIKILTLMLEILMISLISFASINALTINSVRLSPDEIAPGETAQISITLDNDGDNDLKEVSISLDFKDIPFAPFNSGSEYGIELINEGDSETAEFEIVALNDASSGIYKIPVKISYKENDELKSKESLISMGVFSKPEIAVQVEDGLFIKEKETDISIKVVNKGLSKARFLEVELGNSNYYSINSPMLVYLGDIESDDFDSAEFKILIKENAPSKLNIPVNIIYKDVKNKELTTISILQIRTYSTKEAIQLGLIKRNNTLLIVIIIAVVIIIYMIYRKIKKNRKLKKAIQS